MEVPVWWLLASGVGLVSLVHEVLMQLPGFRVHPGSSCAMIVPEVLVWVPVLIPPGFCFHFSKVEGDAKPWPQRCQIYKLCKYHVRLVCFLPANILQSTNVLKQKLQLRTS
jgi:hypothetical protein